MRLLLPSLALIAFVTACPGPSASPPGGHPTAPAPPSATEFPPPGASSAPPSNSVTASTPPTARHACGREPGAPIVPAHVPFAAGPRCDAIETIWANVPSADLACAHDDECTIVEGEGNCFVKAMRADARGKPDYKDVPCGNPASGACPAFPRAPICREGCCASR